MFPEDATEIAATTADRPDSALITADKVKGTAVYNTAEERLGSIDSILIDKRSGEVAYVVMSFGGFLGIGEQYHPLPWHVLDYDTRLGGYRVALDRAALEGAPAYTRDDVDSFDYDRDAEGIDDYYGPDRRNLDRGGLASAAAADRTTPDSDANDGINRPLGYYSSQAQADRSVGQPATPGETNEAAGGPGFYSPDQQTARNSRTSIDADGGIVGATDTGTR